VPTRIRQINGNEDLAVLAGSRLVERARQLGARGTRRLGRGDVSGICGWREKWKCLQQEYASHRQDYEKALSHFILKGNLLRHEPNVAS
jgi:hypothetical protein